MSDVHNSTKPQYRFGSRRRTSAGPSVVLVALSVTATLAAVAFAAASTAVNSASNSTLGQTVAVNGRGLTLYSLSPETAHHLLCKSSECFKRWPPFIVHSSTTRLKAGPGVQGSLKLLRRGAGKFQVTLRGKPLYRYGEDHVKGDAHGDGIESFGGTWHAVTAGTGMAKATPTPPSKPEPLPGY